MASVLTYYYADASCSTPLVLVSKCSNVAYASLAEGPSSTCPGYYGIKVFRIGAAVPTFYSLSNSVCSAAPNTTVSIYSASYDFHAPGAEVASPGFVAFIQN
jgi:hypothetical protein